MAILSAVPVLKLVATDVEDCALGAALRRHTAHVAVLDDRTDPNVVRTAAADYPNTHLVMLIHPPAAVPVLQLMEEGVTCLSKRSAGSSLVAALLLATQGHDVASKGLSASRTHGLGQRLTPREREVLGYLEKGYTDRRIADVLQISIETVRTHNTNIYRKLCVRRRDLIRKAQGDY